MVVNYSTKTNWPHDPHYPLFFLVIIPFLDKCCLAQSTCPNQSLARISMVVGDRHDDEEEACVLLEAALVYLAEDMSEIPPWKGKR